MLKITRGQTIGLYSLMMLMPIGTEFDHVDTDNYGTHLIKAYNEFGERWYKLFAQGGTKDVTEQHKSEAAADQIAEV